jgi:SAM-dependent methyltransferase
MSLNDLVNCPLCDGLVGLYWPRIGIFRCPKCELLFRDISSGDEAMDSLYEGSWQSPVEHASETGGTTSLLAGQYLSFLCKSLNKENLVGLNILDFGAGSGVMSEVLRNHGALVTAVEPFGYEYVAERKIPVYRSLEEMQPMGRVFDGVVSLEVVEHLQDPLKDLKIMHSLIKPDGWLYISTPNSQGLNARLKQDHWREVLKAGHLALYNPKSLSKLLLLAGFGGKRLKWWIKYQDSKIIQIKDFLLQQFWLDGDLRMLAFLDS